MKWVQEAAQFCAQPHGEALLCVPPALFALGRALWTMHWTWLVLLLPLVACFAYNVWRTRQRSRARGWKELAKASAGLFLDPLQCRIESKAELRARGNVVGQRVVFDVVLCNSYGSRLRLPPKELQDGWAVTVGGAANVIADCEVLESESALRYSFQPRKTGVYVVHVKFRGQDACNAPFYLHFKAGSVDVMQCQYAGNSLGRQVLCPKEWTSFVIQTFDALSNRREEGGNRHLFNLQVVEKGSGRMVDANVIVIDNGDGTYRLKYSLPRTGAYDVQVLYDGSALSLSAFPVCVLDREAYRQAQKLVGKNRATFKVGLPDHPKANALLTLTHSQLNLSVVKLRIFSSSIETMRLTRNLRMDFISKKEDDGDLFHIVSPSYLKDIACSSPERNLIFGTLLLFVEKKTGNLVGSFEKRRQFFYHKLEKQHQKQMGSAAMQSFTVEREGLVKSAYAATKGVKWRAPWRVHFAGERGIDQGGLRREFLTVLCRELFMKPETGLFSRLSEDLENVHPSVHPDLLCDSLAVVPDMGDLKGGSGSAGAGSGGGGGSGSGGGGKDGGGDGGDDEEGGVGSLVGSVNLPIGSGAKVASLLGMALEGGGGGGDGAASGAEEREERQPLWGDRPFLKGGESKATKKLLKKYEFAGKVLAKCLYDTVCFDSPCLINVPFSRSFYKYLLDLPLHYSDFQQDDPSFFDMKVKYLLENEIDDLYLELVFSEEEVITIPKDDGGNDGAGSDKAEGGSGDKKIIREVELKPGGRDIEVTDANKMEYLLLLANYRLCRKVKRQLDSFCKGFFSVIPRELLAIFDEQELELLFCGLPEFDVEDMKRHTRYEGFDVEGHFAAASGGDDASSGRSQLDKNFVEWFWNVVENLNDAERARLLQFITGSSQVPADGFSAFNPRITLARSYGSVSNLPTAHTCVNMIDLPRYSSYEDLYTKLMIAITEGSEGFGFS